MTKKEQELQQRLLDLLEANNKVLEQVFELLTKLANPLLPVAPPEAALNLKPGAITVVDKEKVADDNPTGLALHGETPPEEPVAETCTDTEITPEYCRKALKAITKKTSTEDAKAFLAKFGDAKTIPQLDKKYYEDFIAGATEIMGAE